MSHLLEDMQESDEKRFRVVAALIRQNSKVLLTQRWPGKHLALTWEFPGGKVEAGESDEEALRRELKEELGIEVDIGTCCFETYHGYGSREVHLLIYRCHIRSGTPEAIDVKAVEWADQRALLERNFPPADLPFVSELVAGRLDDEGSSSANEEEIEFKPARIVRRP